MRSASNLWEWLTSNFSKQYHCWMKHKRHENQGNDHRLVKLVILNKVELAFFSRTSQGQNALPRPGLEPGSSDSKPSALTTGLPNKAVALMCPRYSWPRVLKVAPCTVVRSYGRTSKFFPRDGLLRYCINMGYALRAPLLIQYEPDEWWE